MSQENVETMRKIADAFNRRDRDTWLSLNDPDLEFRADPEWPESETVRGSEAVWTFIVALDEAWEPADYRIVDAIEAGDNTLATRITRPVQGKASGITDELDYWCVGVFRDGRLLRQDWFSDRDRALAAAGLS